MQRRKTMKKTLAAVSVALAGGTLLGGGCMNTLASLPICGGLLPWCTPTDQLNMFYPLLEVPDFGTDPSCTIPLGCGSGDLYTNIPTGMPGGDASDAPSDTQGGGTEGGGGG